MAFGYAVYFTERAKNRVVRWEPDSGDVDVVAGEPADEDADQKFRDPYGLAFDKKGDLLVADKLNNRICRLKKGKLEALALRDENGHRARGPKTRRCYSPALLCPTGLFIEPEGTLLCSFSDDYTIYRIYSNGRLELVLGMTRNRNYHFSETPEKVSPPEVSNTPINGPTGVVKHSDGTIYFIERRPQVVRRFHPSRGLDCIFPLSKSYEFIRTPEAPASAAISDYHPAYPGALALDPGENLYMTDVKHACVLRIDVSKSQITRVIQLKRPLGPATGGISAVAFGVDGTAWVLNSMEGVVQGYQPRSQGEWTPTSQRLTEIGGKPVKLPDAGSGIAVGA